MGLGSTTTQQNLRSMAEWHAARMPEMASTTAPKKPTMLLVNASEETARALKGSLAEIGHKLVRASTVPDAAAAISQNEIDLVLVDIALSEARGLEFCRFIKKNPETQFIPVFTLGTSGEGDQEIRALDAGANEFVALPLRPRVFKARVQAHLRQKSIIDSMDDSESVLFSLAQSVKDRDPDLGQHCHRLAIMGAAMGLTLRLPSADILALQRGGYLHDIGKVAVPDHVLFKPGPLTPAEWQTMKNHTERGARICGGLKSLSPVLPIIRHHHERWDGSGYPTGLRGEEIPLLARILQLADIYDALTTARPYKEAMTPEQALATIRDEARHGWRDPKLVELFSDVLPAFSKLHLSNDQSQFSLHALASSFDTAHKEPQSSSKTLQAAKSSRDLRLASGF